jgi:hypothetical protein
VLIHRKLIVHIEFHWGYRPRLSVRWAPRAGDREHGGVLVRCRACSGDGLLLQDNKAFVPHPRWGPWEEQP